MRREWPAAFECEMRDLLGEECDALLDALSDAPLKGLRANSLKPSPRLQALLKGWPRAPRCEDGYIAPESLRPGRSPLHAAGLYYMQEPAAMAPALALKAKPGMRVLDLCAAPGGKTTQLAAAMEGKGVLVANEIHPGRARVLLENLERLGVSNAIVVNERPERLLRHFGRWFDAILVDAPCSGEGMFRRDEEAVRQWSMENVELCRRRQGEILACAAGMLRGGGRLVYSTCTFNRRENEGSVQDFLENHPDFSLDGEPVRILPNRERGEGQFYAAFHYNGEGADAELAPLRCSPSDKRYIDFAKRSLRRPWEGPLLCQGDWVYGVSEGMPEVRGLKVLRAGLQLGQLKKDRFEPAHALALWSQRDVFVQSMELDDEQAERYLSGLSLEGNLDGWGVVTVDGWGLGLCKGSGGQVKNHYPKGLRI